MRQVLAFLVLASVRVLGALINVVDDTDETYNYWEPVHYLLFGSGMQTWEMSPEFALRSWWYPWVVSVCARPLASLMTKRALWLALRCALALGCAASESFLARGVARAWGSRAAWSAVLVCALSPGIFMASSALLPNALSMVLFNVAWGAALQRRWVAALYSAAAGVLLGVPFAAVLVVPLALVVLVRLGVARALKHAVVAALLLVVPQVALDRHFYGRWTLAIWNIVRYNALSSDVDSTLYGVEPASFYIKSLVLAFNVALPLAALGLLLLVWQRRWTQCLLVCAPLALWLVFMFVLPHKEVRFLFPCYPFVVLLAALGLSALPRSVGALFVILAVALCASRLSAVQVHYGGPRDAFWELGETREGTLCLGAEWHMFPTSFVTPLQVHFVPSAFGGLLPKPFAESTRDVPPGMNRFNRGDPHHPFLSLDDCDYMVRVGEEVPEGWRLVRKYPLAAQSRGNSVLRAFYVPYLSVARVHFDAVCLLARVVE